MCNKRIADATTEALGIKSDADEYSQAKHSSADEYSANTKAKADEYSKNTRADADNYAETVKAAADDKAQGIIDDASKRGAEMIKATKRNIRELRNKSFGVIEKASKVGIDKLTVAEDARSSVAKLLADLSAQVASFSNTGSDVLKELKGNTVESLSAEFDSRVLDMTSDAQTVDDVLEEDKKPAEEPIREPAEEQAEEPAEEPAGEPVEEPVEDTVPSKEPPAPPVQEANASQGITTSKKTAALQHPSESESTGEETVVLPVAGSTDTQEELPVATSEMTALGLEAVADME